MNPTPIAQREALLDVLRALALFGVMVVNIQTFCTGFFGNTLGLSLDPSSRAEWWTLFFVAAFLEFKAYPILAFLFAYGLTWQAHRAAVAGESGQELVTRRLWLMVAFGVVHGFVFYYGDVLSRYAVTAALVFVSTGFAAPLMARRARAAAWIVVAVMSLLTLTSLLALMWQDSEDALRDLSRMRETREVYATGTVLAVLRQRAHDFTLLFTLFPFSLPNIMLPMYLGVIAARRGILHRRMAPVWPVACTCLRWGLGLGLPVSLVYGFAQASLIQNPASTRLEMLYVVAGAITPLLSIGYVGLLLAVWPLVRNNTPVHWLARVGRLSLTHYLGQSVLMGALLLGYGAGKGATWGPVELTAAGIAIYVGLAAICVAITLRWRMGPAEWLMRKLLYRPRAA